jgi:hypothetical protein
MTNTADTIATTISSLIIFVIVLFAVVLVLRLYRSFPDWDKAYSIRLARLRVSLPSSVIFPAVLSDIYYPRVGTSSGVYQHRAVIAYVKEDNLIFEKVGYSGSPDNLIIHEVLNRPVALLNMRRESGFITGRSYSIYGGIYVTAEGKKRLAGPYLIRRRLRLSSSLGGEAKPLTGKFPKDQSAQEQLVDELIRLGATLE